MPQGGHLREKNGDVKLLASEDMQTAVYNNPQGDRTVV